MQETWVRSLGQEDPLVKEMATHATTLAWRIPWMEEPGGQYSMGSQSWTQLSVCVHAWIMPLALEPDLDLGLSQGLKSLIFWPIV